MQTINALFATAVARFGERPALIEPADGAEMSVLSYHALQERARGFAGYLQQQQIAQGERILIWSASRSDWMAAYLGALLLGIVVVPLDVNTKEDFLGRIAAVTGAKLILTTRKQYDGAQAKQPAFRRY